MVAAGSSTVPVSCGVASLVVSASTVTTGAVTSHVTVMLIWSVSDRP